jgi:superfamily II DNA/RNA helicase
VPLKHDDINKVLFYPLVYLPVCPEYKEGILTNIAFVLSSLATEMADDDFRDKLAWILTEIPDTRIDIELNAIQNAIMVSAVFADDVDATAFRLQWV